LPESFSDFQTPDYPSQPPLDKNFLLCLF
jgi:hypothetical protein